MIHIPYLLGLWFTGYVIELAYDEVMYQYHRWWLRRYLRKFKKYQWQPHAHL